MTTLRLSYTTEDELDRKLCVIMQRRGFRVEKAGVEPVTVGELARQVGRHPRSVSRSLHRYGLDRFRADIGSGKQKRRIKRLWPDERLVRYLTKH